MRKTKETAVKTDEKILICDNDVDRFIRLADARIERGDNIGALGFLFRALEVSEDLQVIIDIADIYADMEMYELSNKFWFIYLSKAPQGKEGIAYEELGINFFYMDNLLMSGYYFHKKLDTDGYLTQEGLDKDIAEYFSEVISSRDCYKIAYPPERTDYSDAIKEAKRSIVVGDYATAERYFESVPAGCPQYSNALNELAMLKFVRGDIDGGIELARKHLNECGENLCAYANLSSMYFYKRDADKSRYYYNQAISLPVLDSLEYYKLATCSLEQGEHQKALLYLEKILKERPYEINIRYLYALALTNCGKYELAFDEFSYLTRLKPWDGNLKFYSSLVKKLSVSGDKDDILPLEYVDSLPSHEELRRLAVINGLPRLERDKINRALKNQDVFECVFWGIVGQEENVSKLCALALSSSSLKKAEKAIAEILVDPDAPLQVKEILLYIYVIYGNKKPVSVVKVNCFDKVRPRKLRFEKTPDCEVFFAAYSMCFSRLAMTSIKNLDKIAFSAERVFKKLYGAIPQDQIGTNELCVLIAKECGYKELSEKKAMELFSPDKAKYNNLKSLMEK